MVDGADTLLDELKSPYRNDVTLYVSLQHFRMLTYLLSTKMTLMAMGLITNTALIVSYGYVELPLGTTVQCPKEFIIEKFWIDSKLVLHCKHFNLISWKN